MSNGLNLPFEGTVGTDGVVFQINQGDSSSGQGGTAIVANSYGLARDGTPAVGLTAFSDVGDAVSAVGKNGIHGQSASAETGTAGVLGENTGGGNGVRGTSPSGIGVLGESGTGAGIIGIGSSGGDAARFFGPVSVSGGPVVVNGDVEVHGNLTSATILGPLQVGGDLSIGGSLHSAGDLDVLGNITARDVLLPGADCAENFDAEIGERLEAGTVVVMGVRGVLRESREAYDKKVVGVVSGAGEYKHGILLDTNPSPNYRVAVALLGKTYCKVDAQYGPIEIGDLLTTSLTPGHAMKATHPSKAFGAVIGKALGHLDAGRGLIPMLVTSQ
jgi:hypothetical protein